MGLHLPLHHGQEGVDVAERGRGLDALDVILDRLANLIGDLNADLDTIFLGFTQAHTLQDFFRDDDARDVLIHEVRIPEGDQRINTGDQRDGRVIFADAVDEPEEGFRVKDGLGDGVFGACVNLPEEAIDFARHLNSDGIAPDPHQEDGRFADGFASSVHTVVEVVGHSAEADGVDVIDTRGIRIVAELGRVACDEEPVLQT